MKLNCKPGDLAIVVRSACGNEGRIVECVRTFIGDGIFGVGPRWVTNPPLRNINGFEVGYPLDACLRPLRDSDGEDEVLRLVGRPVGTPQAA